MNGGDRDHPRLHAFGLWRFDAGTGDLSDDETTSRLEPQVAKLLHHFLVYQDTLISRDELLAAVWDNRIVSDDAVNRCISILRQTLTPEARNAYIETVVRRGFISHFPPPQVETGPGPKRRRSNPWMLGALAGAVSLLLIGAVLMFSDSTSRVPRADATGPPMVAVLPFTSSGQAEDSDLFATGMHDDLLTQLAQLQSIRVISRTSVSEYGDSERNIREIGRELGADVILEGGVQRVGDQIRMNVQLIDAHSDVHLWAKQYDRELTTANIFGIQAEIARSIASALNSTLTQRDATQLNVLPTENMAAYRAYHEAMKLREIETIGAPAYMAALERAVAQDPNFVRAWAELAGALSYVNLGRREADSIQRLEHMLERIRALSPQSSEYLIAQAYYTYYVLKDHDHAYELISQARLLRPSDVQVLELQSWIQRRQGDIAGSIESIRQAQTLDPRSLYLSTRLVSNLVLAHRYDEAIAALEGAPVDNFRLAVLHSTLRVRDHHDPGRLLEDVLELQQEYATDASPFELWEAHIAARDFEGAMALLDAFQAAERPAAAWRFIGIPDVHSARVITVRHRDGRDQVDGLLVEARARLEREREADVTGFGANFYLAMSLVTAAGGRRSETERLVRMWLREATQDLAEFVIQRHYACRALGMAGAVSPAVECLRSALLEPSQAAPFIEPFLPYYDAVSEDSEFLEFLVEIRGG